MFTRHRSSSSSSPIKGSKVRERERARAALFSHTNFRSSWCGSKVVHRRRRQRCSILFLVHSYRRPSSLPARKSLEIHSPIDLLFFRIAFDPFALPRSNLRRHTAPEPVGSPLGEFENGRRPTWHRSSCPTCCTITSKIPRDAPRPVLPIPLVRRLQVPTRMTYLWTRQHRQSTTR
jgi:hypothetical protein